MRSGRFQASYVYDDGVRYYAPHTYDNKGDAEGWLFTERKLIELGEWSPPEARAARKVMTGVTLREYVQSWMPNRDLTPTTRSLYARLLDTRILPGLGDQMLRAINPAQVRSWWINLGKETPTSNAHAYQLLKTIYNTALEEKLVKENPCQLKSAGKPPKARDVQLLTPSELETISKSVPERYRAAVFVAAWCGLRFGELIELRRKDVRTRNGFIVLTVRRSATRVGKKLVVGPTKTQAGSRDVHVPPHVAELLSDHLKSHTGRGPEAFVFTTTRDQRLSRTAFTKMVKRGYLVVGKPEMRVHDLRHVGATLAAQAGATTKELMARLGHATPGMAMRYQIASQDRDAKLAVGLTELACN